MSIFSPNLVERYSKPALWAHFILSIREEKDTAEFPGLRTVAETSAVLVLGLVDFATDFISITQSIGDEKVQHQVGPVMSHKRSLLAEEQQLYGELDRHFVDALTPWLDPVPPNKAREATATKKQTKNFKEGNVHQKRTHHYYCHTNSSQRQILITRKK